MGILAATVWPIDRRALFRVSAHLLDTLTSPAFATWVEFLNRLQRQSTVRQARSHSWRTTNHCLCRMRFTRISARLVRAGFRSGTAGFIFRPQTKQNQWLPEENTSWSAIKHE